VRKRILACTPFCVNSSRTAIKEDSPF